MAGAQIYEPAIGPEPPLPQSVDKFHVSLQENEQYR